MNVEEIKSEQITIMQTIAIIMNTMIGVSILSLPRLSGIVVGKGIIFSILIAILISLVGIFILSRLVANFPTLSFIELSDHLIGKPLSRFFGITIVLLIIFLTSMVAREFSSMMNTTMLLETPIFVTTLMIFIVVAISVRNDISTFAHIHFFYLPCIIIPIIFLILILLKDVETINLLPIFDREQYSLQLLFLEGIKIAGLPFMQIGTFIISLTVPFMVDKKQATKGSFIGVTTAGIFILIITLITIAVLGIETVKIETWPMLILARMIELPGEIFDRMDIIFLLVWILSGFTTIFSCYFLSAYTASRVFKLKSHRSITFILLPIFIVLTLLPHNIVDVYHFMNFGQYGLILTIIYPFLLYIISLFRNGKGVRL